MADTFDTSTIEQSLTKKIGGLPGFAWVGIGVIAVFAFKKYKKGSAISLAAPMGASNGANPADLMASAPPAEGTNAQWQANAATHLAKTGSYSASDIQNALANYQSGNGLTGNQQTIIDSILPSFGTPPQGIQPIYQPQIDLLPYYAPADIAALAPTAGGTPTPIIATNPFLPAPIVGAQPSYTPYTGGALLSSGATAGAIDTSGNSVFIPAPGAPSINLPPYVAPTYSPQDYSPYWSPVNPPPTPAPAPTNVQAQPNLNIAY